MLENIPVEIGQINELVRLLNSTIEALNMKLLTLNHTNIRVLNYIPLSTDAPLGAATPKDGWIRAVKLAGQTELQLYNGTAWVTLARVAYVDQQDDATLASAKAYTDSEISNLTLSTNGSHTHSVTTSTGTYTTTSNGSHTHTIS